MKLFTALAAAALAITTVGCASPQEAKIEKLKRVVSSTPYCQPVKAAETYKQVLEAHGSVFQANLEVLEFAQTDSCGKQVGEYMAANLEEYKETVLKIAQYQACMENVRACN